jgi:hypothetical protein
MRLHYLVCVENYNIYSMVSAAVALLTLSGMELTATVLMAILLSMEFALIAL